MAGAQVQQLLGSHLTQCSNSAIFSATIIANRMQIHGVHPRCAYLVLSPH
jgi:hypothetical protein